MGEHSNEGGISRRRALAVFGAAGAASVLGNTARAWAACTLTPAQTAGPFWVDERLNRSDITVDPVNGAVLPGVPLELVISVVRADGDCAPAAGLQVDVWHCAADGRYSDEPSNGTAGEKFLRGYQLTGENGEVRFRTIYPGWYPGRTVHIHFRVRAFAGTSTATNFASQLYFDDAVSNQVLSEAPYNARGARNVTNANDGIFANANVLALTANGSGGYVGAFQVGLNGLPVVAPTASPVASPTSTATPTACTGDCDNSGSVDVDELVHGVNLVLDNADVSTCGTLDANASGKVTIDEIIRAVNVARDGCG